MCPYVQQGRILYMNEKDFINEVFGPIFHKQGLDGTLDNEQITALMGICAEEFVKEQDIAFEFIKCAPCKEDMESFYRKERAKEANSIEEEIDTISLLSSFFSIERAKEANSIEEEIDTSREVINIGKLVNIKFSPEMWEAVVGCRLSGHFVKLDVLANFYASKWGNPINKTYSIDAAINKKDKKLNATHFIWLGGFILLVLVLVFLLR